MDAVSRCFATGLVGVVGYGIAATVLTSMAIGRFDEAADRPRRPFGSPRESPLGKPKPDEEDDEL